MNYMCDGCKHFKKIDIPFGRTIGECLRNDWRKGEPIYINNLPLCFEWHYEGVE